MENLERATSVSFHVFGVKDKLLPFYSLVRGVVERASTKNVESPMKNWTMLTDTNCLEGFVQDTKGEDEIRYAVLPRLRSLFPLRSSDSHGASEYEKQLESSALCRWPSRNINFHRLHLASNVFAERRRRRLGLLHHMLFDTLLLFSGPETLAFSCRFNVSVSGAILMREAPQDTRQQRIQ